jgi:hypothetical protein
MHKCRRSPVPIVKDDKFRIIGARISLRKKDEVSIVCFSYRKHRSNLYLDSLSIHNRDA